MPKGIEWIVVPLPGFNCFLRSIGQEHGSSPVSSITPDGPQAWLSGPWAVLTGPQVPMLVFVYLSNQDNIFK